MNLKIVKTKLTSMPQPPSLPRPDLMRLPLGRSRLDLQCKIFRFSARARILEVRILWNNKVARWSPCPRPTVTASTSDGRGSDSRYSFRFAILPFASVRSSVGPLVGTPAVMLATLPFSRTHVATGVLVGASAMTK